MKSFIVNACIFNLFTLNSFRLTIANIMHAMFYFASPSSKLYQLPMADQGIMLIDSVLLSVAI